MSRPIPFPERSYPLERRRATVIAIGLLGFGTGFALAGMLVLSNQSGHPLWFVAIGFGLVSIGVVGVAISRGTVPMPSTPIWSPPTLRLPILFGGRKTHAAIRVTGEHAEASTPAFPICLFTLTIQH